MKTYKKVISLACAFGLVASVALTGCASNATSGSSQSSAAQSSSNALQSSAQSSSVVAQGGNLLGGIEIGKSEDNQFAIEVENDTNNNIIGVAYKDPAEDDFSANLMQTGSVWANDQKAKVFFPNIEGTYTFTYEENNGSKKQEQPQYGVRQIFDIQVTFENGDICVLHSFVPIGVTDVELKFDPVANICYLEYKNLNGTEESTQANETAIAEMTAEAQAAASEAQN